MSGQSFEPLDYAQNQLAPLLTAIVASLQDEAKPEQERFFSAILRGIQSAQSPADLADPFMELSMSSFMGFDFSPSVALLLDQLLIFAQQLAEVLSLDDEDRN